MLLVLALSLISCPRKIWPSLTSDKKTHLTVSGNRRGLRKSLFLWPIRCPGRGANTINYLVGRIDGIFPAVHEKSPRIYPLFFFSQVISFKNNLWLFRKKCLFSQPKESHTFLSNTVEYVTSSAMSGDLTSCHQGRQSHLYVHEPIGSQVIIPTDWCRRPLSLTDGRWYVTGCHRAGQRIISISFLFCIFENIIICSTTKKEIIFDRRTTDYFFPFSYHLFNYNK